MKTKQAYIKKWIELSLFPIRKINKKTPTSYGLKQLCEQSIGDYVSNDEFKDVMSEVGYTGTNEINPYYNISSKIKKVSFKNTLDYLKDNNQKNTNKIKIDFEPKEKVAARDIRLTLCDKKLIGDIPQYNLKSFAEVEEMINHWLETKKTPGVFICFDWNEGVKYEDEYTRFFITHKPLEVKNNFLPMIKLSNHIAIFEDATYEDAFGYCKDLKEGL